MRVLRTVVLVVVALVALLVGGTWVFLQTRWGGETVRRLALPRLNAAIAGRIAAERFRFGGDRIVLEGAALHDPAGAQVLSVERLEIAFSPLALLGRRVEISKLAIEGPRLWLVAEKSGTNLARALAPRHPTARAAPPAPSQTGGPGWVVDVAGIALSDGAFAYVGPTGKRVAHIDDLATRGHVRLARDGDKPDAHDVLELDLATDARGAHLAASGALDLTTLRARDPGLIVRGEGIVLAELFAAAPSSHFGFVLKVEGGGPTLAELDGRLTLRVPEGELAGQTLGPIAFSLQAAAGRYQLADLKAAFPGLKITGEATATSTRVDGRLRVEARDSRRHRAQPGPAAPTAAAGARGPRAARPRDLRPARGAGPARGGAVPHPPPRRQHAGRGASVGDRPRSLAADPRHRRRRRRPGHARGATRAGARAAPRRCREGPRRRAARRGPLPARARGDRPPRQRRQPPDAHVVRAPLPGGDLDSDAAGADCLRRRAADGARRSRSRPTTRPSLST